LTQQDNSKIIFELKQVEVTLRKKLDNFIVKDTFTKGKQAGIRKSINIINNKIDELNGGV